jgi:class 3 adenylate cyclase
VLSSQINSLLMAMLPESVLLRLSQGEERVFDVADVASVSFSDVAGFTNWSSSRTSAEVVQLVSTMITAYDGAARECQVAKVKTIGDADWAICGLPEKPDECAARICNFGLRQQELLVEMNAKNPQWGNVELRVGCHTGPLAGGVVGSKQLSYEVFGKTNEIAEHHEQSAPRGGVLVSARTMSVAAASGLYTFASHTAVVDGGATFVVSRKTQAQQQQQHHVAQRRGSRRGSRGAVLNLQHDRAKVMRFFGIDEQPHAQSELSSVCSTIDGRSMGGGRTPQKSRVGTPLVLPLAVSPQPDAHLILIGGNDAGGTDDGGFADELPPLCVDPEKEDEEAVVDRSATVGSGFLYKFADPDVEEAYYDFDTGNKKQRRQVTALRQVFLSVACIIVVLIVVPAEQRGDTTGGISLFAVAAALSVGLFLYTRNAPTSRIMAKIAFGTAMVIAVIMMVANALLPMHTTLAYSLWATFAIGLLISPPAELPLAVHVLYMAGCGVLNMFINKTFPLTFQLLYLVIWTVMAFIWYGYSQDRHDRTQYAIRLQADTAATAAEGQAYLQRAMLGTMAPAHVQSDMVALVATPAYRAGEPASLTHDLSNVTVCFCKTSTETEHSDAAAAYADVMGVHTRVERVLAKYPGAIKIKTVGATLVVAGPLSATATEAERVAAARDIFGFAHEVVHGHTGLARRAGVCTGNVMATVMGTDRIAYDIFGDTVNTSSRCMSTAAEFSMQAAQSTTTLCGADHTRPAGETVQVFMKGKGDVDVSRYSAVVDI